MRVSLGNELEAILHLFEPRHILRRRDERGEAGCNFIEAV